MKKQKTNAEELQEWAELLEKGYIDREFYNEKKHELLNKKDIPSNKKNINYNEEKKNTTTLNTKKDDIKTESSSDTKVNKNKTNSQDDSDGNSLIWTTILIAVGIFIVFSVMNNGNESKTYTAKPQNTYTPKPKIKKDPIVYYSLTIETTPRDAIVRIMNIKPKYKNGIVLKKGRYHIRVDKKGYSRIDQWVELNKNEYFTAELKKIKVKKVIKDHTYKKVEEPKSNNTYRDKHPNSYNSSSDYYYYPKSKQDCYDRGLKPVRASNGTLICNKVGETSSNNYSYNSSYSAKSSSSSDYYYYPTSKQDCYNRGLKPVRAANGTLICNKVGETKSNNYSYSNTYSRKTSSSDDYYYYPTSRQDCYNRGMKPVDTPSGSLICKK